VSRHHLALTLIALGSSGCAAVGPGLHLSEGAVEGRGTAQAPIAISDLTPALLTAQAEERARAATSRPRDPAATRPGPYLYRIAPHDILSVTVWDHPELTIPAGEFRAADLAGNVVQGDGTVFYPHVGVVEVAGRTLPEIRALFTQRLKAWVENPQLDVRVVGYRGQKVQVSGEVLQPSTIPVTDVPLRVQDAIAQAKGLGPAAWPRGVTLTRGGTTYALDLQAAYAEGDLSQDWLLQDGDLLHVPSREQYKVFVLGEVRKPSSKVMVRGAMSLAEAIGDSEGFDPLSANPGAIYVFRGRYETPRVFRLDASNADALLLAVQFQLEPLDVIYVAATRLTDWNRLVGQLLPTIQGLWQTVDLGNRAVTTIKGP
jgi:polysaccharide export outer membrane protein